ncbi:hypothetical protein [Frankia sp. ArI3]|uniref:hypothetical protein n=1 Tax=Frankia sp. ArI3 TaxID=1858 RepID=UPI002104B0BC|nr:hypothetical protein [Frankia sp. ArI3]
MARHVGDAQRAGIAQALADQTAAQRQPADRPGHALGETDVDELGDLAGLADDPEGAVFGVDELAGGLRDAAQRDRQAQFAGDVDHRVEQALHPRLHRGHLVDLRGQAGAQLVERRGIARGRHRPRASIGGHNSHRG